MPKRHTRRTKEEVFAIGKSKYMNGAGFINPKMGSAPVVRASPDAIAELLKGLSTPDIQPPPLN